MQHQSMEYRKNESRAEREGSEASSTKGNFPPMSKHVSAGYYQYNNPGYGSGSQVRGQQSDQFSVTQFPNMQSMQNVQPFQMSMQFPPYAPSVPSVPYPQIEGSFSGNNYQLESIVRKEKERVKILEQELEEKEEDSISLKRLQKKLKNFSSEYNEKMEDMLEQFMQKIV